MKREYRHRCPHQATVLFCFSAHERSSRAARRERVRVPMKVAGDRTLSPDPSPGGRGKYSRHAYRRVLSACVLSHLSQRLDASSDASFPA